MPFGHCKSVKQGGLAFTAAVFLLSEPMLSRDGWRERTRLADSLVWIAPTRSMFYWPSGTPWLETALFWESLFHIFDKDKQV